MRDLKTVVWDTQQVFESLVVQARLEHCLQGEGMEGDLHRVDIEHRLVEDIGHRLVKDIEHQQAEDIEHRLAKDIELRLVDTGILEDYPGILVEVQLVVQG